jgi:hypothetical protein
VKPEIKLRMLCGRVAFPRGERPFHFALWLRVGLGQVALQQFLQQLPFSTLGLPANIARPTTSAKLVTATCIVAT